MTHTFLAPKAVFLQLGDLAARLNEVVGHRDLLHAVSPHVSHSVVMCRRTQLVPEPRLYLT